MNLNDRLLEAQHLLCMARPDSGLWSGAAARQYQLQLDQLVAELSNLRASLWQ